MLFDKLDSAPELYTISKWGYRTSEGPEWVEDQRTVRVDPDNLPTVLTDCGWEESPLAVVLGHEFAHAATGIEDEGPGRMSNVNLNENLIRSQMGLPARRRY